jgi:NADPH:quinone reductase
LDNAEYPSDHSATSMHAAVISELGRAPEAGERPDPHAREGETLIEVLAAPLNPIDIAVGAGTFYGGHPPLPYVPGAEAVGRVRESGRFEPGALVWAYGQGFGVSRDGGLAELASVPSEAVVAVPSEADAVLAGALGIAGMAGWLPLAWRAPVRAGETVLVLGATGTVGLVAVQAARLLGAGRVVAAGRSEPGLERAARAGADATVRLEGDLVAAFREACGETGPTLVVDPLWGEPLLAALEVAPPGARVVQLGQSAGAEAAIPSRLIRGKSIDLLGFTNTAAPADVLHEEYRRLVRHALAGEIELEIEIVPFERLTEAWERQRDGAGHKLVVVP